MFVSLLFGLSLSVLPSGDLAAGMLEDCRELSAQPDDIHTCLDNFLDELDGNISQLAQFILIELGEQNGQSTSASIAFERSQTAFREYRRENCLWYLEFSAPRVWAEQIAKGCLAQMSQARLSELQDLVTAERGDSELSGYYVFGIDRNTFQRCGDQSRYWIVGDNALVSQLQRDYLSRAQSDLEVFYLRVSGQVDTDTGRSYAGHDGVLRLQNIIEMRTPKDGDCLIAIDRPDDKAEISVTHANQIPDVSASEIAALEADSSNVDTEPKSRQELRAYFGAWDAHCKQLGSGYGCVLSVVMEGNNLTGEDRAVFSMTRRSGKRTILDLEFPGQEIDSISRISWSIDKFEIGTIASSRIRVDQVSARQEVRDRSTIQNDLLPLLAMGYNLFVGVREESGALATYTATLVGLTRALLFADEFTQADGTN